MSNRTLSMTDSLYDYLLNTSLRETEIQKKLRLQTASMEGSQMQIAPEQGQFMGFLVRLMGVRRALEVGVYTGYSSLAVALAMPEQGRLVACDINLEWTDVARRFWQQAGIDQKIDLHLAPAAEILNRLLEQGQHSSYDFAFIDADKENYDQYYELCLRLLRPGGLMVIDNTLWGGDVADDQVQDADTRAIRALNKKLQTDTRIDMSHLPIADGLTLVRKI
jgi:caffeoyl-CoA O-methyltransferase